MDGIKTFFIPLTISKSVLTPVKSLSLSRKEAIIEENANLGILD